MTLTFSITFPQTMTPAQYLRDVIGLGKKRVHELRMNEAMTIEGTPIFFDHRVPEGTVAQLTTPLPPSSYLPWDTPLYVAKEDEHFAIVWKEQGWKTHPNDPKETNTCMNAAAYHIDSPYVEHVHRLDEETEGWLLLAKNPIAKAIADALLEDQQIERVYEAYVDGNVRPAIGSFTGNIQKDRHSNKQVVTTRGGKQAQTDYVLLGYDPVRNESHVRLQLKTGRTHQIRVHLAHAGYPIVGDTLYNEQTHVRTMRLQATELTFTHPWTNEKWHVDLSDHTPQQ